MPLYKGDKRIIKVFKGDKMIVHGFREVDRFFAACLEVGWDITGNFSSWQDSVISEEGQCETCDDKDSTGVAVETRQVCDEVGWSSTGSWSSYSYSSNPASGTCSDCSHEGNSGYSSSSRTEYMPTQRECQENTTKEVCATVGWEINGSWTDYIYSTSQTSGTCSNCSNENNTGHESSSRTEYMPQIRTCNVTTKEVCDGVGWASSGSWSSYSYTTNPASGTCSSCSDEGNTGYSSTSTTEYRRRRRVCQESGAVDVCASASWSATSSWSGYSTTSGSSSTKYTNCHCGNLGSGRQYSTTKEYRLRWDTCSVYSTRDVCSSVSWTTTGSWSGYNYSSSQTSGTCSSCSNEGNTGYSSSSRREYRSRSRGCSQSSTSTTCTWDSVTTTTNGYCSSPNSPSCAQGVYRYTNTLIGGNPSCRIQRGNESTSCAGVSWSSYSYGNWGTSRVNTSSSSCTNCSHVGNTETSEESRTRWRRIPRRCYVSSTNEVCESTRWNTGAYYETWQSTAPSTTSGTCTCSTRGQRSVLEERTLYRWRDGNCSVSSWNQVCDSVSWDSSSYTSWGSTRYNETTSSCTSCSHEGNIWDREESRTVWARRPRTCNVTSWNTVCDYTTWGSWTDNGSWQTTAPSTSTSVCNCTTQGEEENYRTRTRWRRRARICLEQTTNTVCDTVSWSSYSDNGSWQTTEPSTTSPTCSDCGDEGNLQNNYRTRTMWRRLARTCIETKEKTQYRSAPRVCIQTKP